MGGRAHPFGRARASTRLDHIQGAPAACLHPTLGFATLQLCNLVWLRVWGLLAGRSQWVADWYQWLQYCWTGRRRRDDNKWVVSQIHQSDIFPRILFLPFCVAKGTFCHFNSLFPTYLQFPVYYKLKILSSLPPYQDLSLVLLLSLFLSFYPFFILLSLPLHPDLSLVLLLQPCSLVLAIKSRLPQFPKQTTHLNIKCNYLAVIISQPHVYV